MAVVYLARDLQHERPVALKVFRHFLIIGETRMATFEQA
jgi:hypothetical protein